MNPSSIQSELVHLIRQMHDKGWSAATGTNYSYRLDQETYMVTISGLDKSKITENDFMQVFVNGGVCEGFEQLKPSAENKIHATIYQQSDAKVILHSHSVFGTVLSQYVVDFEEEDLVISGYEVQKAIEGVSTHEQAIEVPVFANTQNMDDLADEIVQRWKKVNDAKALLIGNHGFYTWGRTISEAKRHMEAYEFLFNCIYHRRLLLKG
jgi:methylthioribulose-1-phosphate dehydratase